MTWLTWRQLRVQGTVVLAAIGALAIALALTGQGLRTAYTDHAAALAGFIEQLQFERFDSFLYLAGLVAVHSAAPVIGAFWGAPLIARELEAGTHRLVWNQSTTRHRWLATKLLVTGGIAVLGVGVLSAVVTWWSSPIDKAIAAGHGSGTFSLPRMVPVVFGARGIVAVGYVLLGLAVGVTLGLLLRRSIPAIALTLVVVGAAELLVPQLVRAHLATPATADVVISTDNMEGLSLGGSPGNPGAARLDIRAGSPGDWGLTNTTVDSAGREQATLPAWFGECVGDRLGPPPDAAGGSVRVRARGRDVLDTCFAQLTTEGYRQRVTYQPASSFWTLQVRETALLLALAGLLTGFCFWRIARDVS